MRTATVVLPICATTAALGLLGLQLRHRPAARPAVIVAPLPIAVTTHAPSPASAHAPARHDHPVGGQYLETDLLITRGDAPPVLLEPHTGDDAFRYDWRFDALANAMARELAAVLDDACPTGCEPAAAARAALQTWLDASDGREAHALRRWTIDDAGIPAYMRRLTVHAPSGGLVIDVACTSRSYTVGMRMWNDETTCVATLRDHGRVLATYRPRQLARLSKESILEPIDAYEQTVELPGSPMLVVKTGRDQITKL